MKQQLKNFLEKSPLYNDLVLPYHWAQAIMATTKYHHPAKKLKVIGVTGTNGKTTTSFMIWHSLNSAGRKTGLITTVAWGGVGYNSKTDHSDISTDAQTLHYTSAHMTTPDVCTLNQRIQAILEAGAEYLVLETTSHALAEFRTLGIPFEIAVFTNLTHDHLDYHKTFTRYRTAKGKLFKKAKYSIFNADDPTTKYYQNLSREFTTYGIHHGSHRATDIKLSPTGIKYSSGDIIIETKIPGKFNVYNSLAAVLVGQKLGLTKVQIQDGLKSLDSVEGRMNIIDEGQNFTVIVDYAHAPDALEKVFESVTPHKGKIISVHGGAGRRDPSTREIRGRILGKYSNIVIITEDDSRDEDPEKIADPFLKGAEKRGKIINKTLFKELDRKKAIQLAFTKAKKGDLVLILGKGHEKTILRADGPHPFEDIKVAQELLKSHK